MYVILLLLFPLQFPSFLSCICRYMYIFFAMWTFTLMPSCTARRNLQESVPFSVVHYIGGIHDRLDTQWLPVIRIYGDRQAICYVQHACDRDTVQDPGKALVHWRLRGASELNCFFFKFSSTDSLHTRFHEKAGYERRLGGIMTSIRNFDDADWYLLLKRCCVHFTSLQLNSGHCQLRVLGVEYGLRN